MIIIFRSLEKPTREVMVDLLYIISHEISILTSGLCLPDIKSYTAVY